MDVASHAALGLSVGYCGFAQRIGRGGALLALAGATLPDLDVFMGIGDEWAGLQYHRFWTHSLLVAPVLGAALAGLWWRFGPCKRFALLWACATTVLVCHCLLDACTSYGTTLLAPLSNHRFAFDWIGIIDPFFTVPLLAGLVVFALRRRRGRQAAAQQAVWAGLGLAIGYLALGATQHALACRLIRTEAATAGHDIVRANAYPQIGSVFLWRLVYQTNHNYYVARANMLTARTPVFARAPISNDELVQASQDHPKVRLFRWFAMDFVRPVTRRVGDRWVVEWHDMRYGWPADATSSLWWAVAWFDQDRHLLRVSRVHPSWRRIERMSMYD